MEEQILKESKRIWFVFLKVVSGTPLFSPEDVWEGGWGVLAAAYYSTFLLAIDSILRFFNWCLSSLNNGMNSGSFLSYDFITLWLNSIISTPFFSKRLSSSLAY